MKEVSRTKALWLEVGAIAAFLGLGNLLAPFAYYGYPTGPSGTRYDVNLHLLGTHLGSIALVLFVLWNSGDALEKFGLRRFGGFNDLALTGLLGILLSAVYLLPNRGSSGYPNFDPLRPTNPIPLVTGVIEVVIAAFFEELTCRGLLVARLEELTAKPWLAVLVSSCFFASLHTYQGWTGVFYAFVTGLILSIAFSSRPSLWPVTIAHAALNLTFFVQLK